jgi:hypothetical protein
MPYLASEVNRPKGFFIFLVGSGVPDRSSLPMAAGLDDFFHLYGHWFGMFD